MKRALFSTSAVAALVALAVLPAMAHHGTLISYDRDAQWTREVVITELHYANPHPQLFFDIVDDGGNAVHWAAEMLPNPAALVRVGWTKARSVAALAPGTHMRVTIAPARAGGQVGLLLKVTDLNGTEVVSESAPYPEPPATAAPAP